MHNLRNELMHYTNDLPDGVDLKAEAVAAIEQIAQYMEKDVLLHHICVAIDRLEGQT